MNGCGNESESGIESKSRDGRGIYHAWNASVCFAPLRGRLVNVGRVALGCFAAVRGMGQTGKGQTGRDR